jgi:hypothetical protein
MPTNRKKHAHPPLVPPRRDRMLMKHGRWEFRWEKGDYHENDEGRVIDGRVYTYHPTKG